MKTIKTIKTIAFFAAITLTLSSYTTINKVEEAAPLGVAGCGSGYTEVSWSVDCNGKNYSGSRCFKSEHAGQAAIAILNAPCPQN